MADAEHGKKPSVRAKGPLQRHPYLVLLGTGIVLVLLLILLFWYFIPILLLTSIIALLCCWKRLDVPKRAIAVGAIVLVVLMCFLLGGENADVTFVKEEGRLPHYEFMKIGDAIDQFMRRTRWKALTEGDNRYVEVRGRAKYDGKVKGDNLEVVLRFRVDRKKNYVRAVSLHLGESKMSTAERRNFLATVFGAYKR